MKFYTSIPWKSMSSIVLPSKFILYSKSNLLSFSSANLTSYAYYVIFFIFSFIAFVNSIHLYVYGHNNSHGV